MGYVLDNWVSWQCICLCIMKKHETNVSSDSSVCNKDVYSSINISEFFFQMYSHVFGRVFLVLKRYMVMNNCLHFHCVCQDVIGKSVHQAVCMSLYKTSQRYFLTLFLKVSCTKLQQYFINWSVFSFSVKIPHLSYLNYHFCKYAAIPCSMSFTNY